MAISEVSNVQRLRSASCGSTFQLSANYQKQGPNHRDRDQWKEI